MSALPKFSFTELEAARFRLDLRAFTKAAWPHIDRAPLNWGPHLDAICDHLAYISMGDIRFFMCNLPPRSGKSNICDVIWPVWDWTSTPERQWLTSSYSLQLSQRDNLKSRRLLDSKWFRERWNIPFTFDEKLKRQYSNVLGGKRIATSTDSTTTGEGGDILMVDDPHNAKEVESDDVRDGTCEWFDGSLSSRMNNQNVGAWAVIGQLTHPRDLFAHIRETHDMKDVVQLVLPNEFDKRRRCVTRLPRTRKVIFKDMRQPGELLFPERLNAEATARLKKVLKERYALQFQQTTTGGVGNIITRDMWQLWDGEPPEVDYVITCWDTAYGENQEGDFHARTDWGIFKYSQPKTVTMVDSNGEPLLDEDDKPRTQTIRMPARNCAILLGNWRSKCPTYELRKLAKEHYRKVRPDYTLIEKKVSGIDLLQEFRRVGIQGVRGINIDHGGRVKMDMTVRVNLIAEVFYDGCVYYLPTRKATEVIDEVCGFRGGKGGTTGHDDYVSTVTMALQWCRRRGELHLWEDETEDGNVRLFKASRRGSIYG